MGKINTDNYPNRPFSSYQDDDMFILQDNGGETYTTNVGDIKNLADSRIKLEGVQVNGSDLPISGKKVNVDISGKTDLRVIAFPFHDPEPGEPSMGFFKGAYVTYNGKLYEFTQEHQGAWNPSHVREITAAGMFVRAGNGGYNTGRYATTEGHSTRAEGEAAHAEGTGTIANSDNQHAGGRYNVADPDDTYVRIIGNGTADNARSNAMTLDWDGNLEVSGEIEDGNGEKISDKTDKVTNATSGHLAGLDSNGNLTDSGVSPTEEVTVEGNPVTFDSPFEQDAKSVVVSVKPIQDLHGYDHPWVGGAGYNQWDEVWESGSIYASSGNDAPSVSKIRSKNYNPVTAGSGYYFLHESTEADLFFYDSNKDYLGETNGHISKNSSGSFTVPNGAAYVRFSILQTTYTSGIAINYPATITTYSPYSNICPISGTNEVEIEVSDGESEPTTTTIPLPSTLYDADVDVTEGSGDEGYNVIVFDGSNDENWTIATHGSLYRHAITISGAGQPNDEAIMVSAYNGIKFDDRSYASDGIAFLSGSAECMLSIMDGSKTTNEEWKAFLAENPIQVCYKLATPTTLSFDPTDVELLEGTNVVTTNAEKVAVTYGRSLWQDIDDLKSDTKGKLNKSDVADVEGDTASRPYSVNEFMLRADGLYKVTAPIASGASITASNTTKTTVGEVLTALLNA